MEGEVGSGARLRKLGALTDNILFLFQRAPNYLVKSLASTQRSGVSDLCLWFPSVSSFIDPTFIEGKLIRTRSVSNLEEGPTGKKSHGSHFN